MKPCLREAPGDQASSPRPLLIAAVVTGSFIKGLG